MTHDADALALLNSLPPLSLDKLMTDTGWSPATVWRYRKKGWLKCENIAGRFYVTRAELARFNARLQAGEFAQESMKPPRRAVAE